MTLRPGMVGVSTIDGRVGAFVKFGQWFMGATRQDARWSHVFLVGYGDTVYEAMPAGMQRNTLSAYLADLDSGDEVMFLDPPVTDQQRAATLVLAQDLVDRRVGYSFVSYAYLFLRRCGVRTAWLRDRIGDIGNMMCSQTVDYVLSAAGVDVFRDGRAWQDVIPADFAVLARTDSRFPVVELDRVR